MSNKPQFVGERVRLGDVLQVVNGKNQKAVEDENGQYPIYGSGGQMGWASSYICPANTVIIGRKGNINKPLYVSEPFWNVDTAFGLVAKSGVLDARYLYHFCKHYDFERLNTTCTIPSLTRKNIEGILLHLPSLEKQKEMTARFDSILKQIALVRQQLSDLDSLVKSRFVEMFGDPSERDNRWPTSRLDVFAQVITGNTPSRKRPDYYGKGTEWVKTDNIVDLAVTAAAEQLTNAGCEKARLAPKGSILMACIAGSVNSIGKVGLLDREVAFNQQINAIVPSDKVDARFLLIMLSLSKAYLCSDVNQQLKGILNKSALSAKRFPLPPFALQQEFASFVSQVDKSRFAKSFILPLAISAGIFPFVPRPPHARKAAARRRFLIALVCPSLSDTLNTFQKSVTPMPTLLKPSVIVKSGRTLHGNHSS